MARSRYSQSELFKKALKLTGGKGVAKRVVPISAKKTGFDTNESMYADILAQLGGAYSDKLADKLDKADLGAARRMRDDYLKPQKDWNVETDGTTPDALRAATMPGALTGNVGATYDPNVKPKPKEYEYDGEEGQALRMAAALGAPNAALGSPLDPGQPYAVGTDEEGDDANWMSAPEHAEFYKKAAAEAQAGFDVDNPTGMARVDQGNYGVAKPQSLLGQVFGGPAPVPKEQTNTLAMRDLLMGDTIAKRENKEAIALAAKIKKQDQVEARNLYKFQQENKKFKTTPDTIINMEGDLSKDYRRTPGGGAEFIPGGARDPAVIRAAEEAKRSAVLESKREEAMPGIRSGIMTKIDRLPILRKNIDEMKELSEGFFTSGIVGQALSPFANTDQYSLESKMKNIQSAVGLQELIDVKARGATFGSLTEKEMDLLISSVGALDPNLGPKDLVPVLEDVYRLYNKGLEGEKKNFAEIYPTIEAPWILKKIPAPPAGFK